MKLLAKTSNPVECENIKTILSSQKITYRIDVRNKNNMFKVYDLDICYNIDHKLIYPYERGAHT